MPFSGQNRADVLVGSGERQTCQVEQQKERGERLIRIAGVVEGAILDQRDPAASRHHEVRDRRNKGDGERDHVEVPDPWGTYVPR